MTPAPTCLPLPATEPLELPGTPSLEAVPPTPAPGDEASIDVERRLRLDERESRSLQTGFEVERAESLNPRVCDVIQFAPREVAIVGKQRGARVDFWQKGQPQERVSYLIAVGQDEDERLRSRDQFAKLHDLIADMYPASRVVLTRDSDSLVVAGTATSREEAIAIVSLVRRLHTIPVADRLTVRPAK